MPDLLGSMRPGPRGCRISFDRIPPGVWAKRKVFLGVEEKEKPEEGTGSFRGSGCLVCHASPSEGLFGESGAGLGSLDHASNENTTNRPGGFLHDP